MKYNFDEDVIEWNKERGFLDKEFNLEKDTGYLVSEVLEALDWESIKNMLMMTFHMTEADESTAELEDELASVENHDDFARWLCKHYTRDGYDNVDYCDMITDLEVFGVGGRAKIGLKEKDISDIRLAVMTKNHSKKPGDVDEHGKQRKGAAFTPPEDVIKGILDSIEQKSDS